MTAREEAEASDPKPMPAIRRWALDHPTQYTFASLAAMLVFGFAVIGDWRAVLPASFGLAAIIYFLWRPNGPAARHYRARPPEDRAVEDQH
jgi:hypothetical protein